MTELQLINLPEYVEYAEEDRENNANTRVYTGEASDRRCGYKIIAQERRDGLGAVGRLYDNFGLVKGLAGDTWLEVWMLLAGEREKLIKKS